MNMRHALVDTALGPVTIVAKNDVISRVFFRHHVHPSEQGGVGPEVSVENDPLLASAATQLHEYLAGIRREFDLPLEASGNAFQRAVWEFVGEIPFGETATCGAIAERLGNETLSYRVGLAVEVNPLRVVVPCHRVLGANGDCKGCTRWGERKKAMLELEVHPQGNITPSIS